MLCAIQENLELKVIAKDVVKTDGAFLCPKCRQLLNLRKGQIRTHHFAHKPPVTCKYGVGESEAHRVAKLSIYNALKNHNDVSDCEIEKNLGEVIPDVYVIIRGTPTAIEVQISSLTLDDIICRTKAYHSKNIAVLWLPLFSDKLNKKKYAPRAWEKWLHAAYFGRVYYWMADLSVVPIHFSNYTTYQESSSWHDQYGEEHYSDGYDKVSKRWKKIKIGKTMNIAEDFLAQDRKAWSGGKMNIPVCRLFIDKQKGWWK